MPFIFHISSKKNEESHTYAISFNCYNFHYWGLMYSYSSSSSS